jgi:hypothetical protein
LPIADLKNEKVGEKANGNWQWEIGNDPVLFSLLIRYQLASRKK